MTEDTRPNAVHTSGLDNECRPGMDAYDTANYPCMKNGIKNIVKQLIIVVKNHFSFCPDDMSLKICFMSK